MFVLQNILCQKYAWYAVSLLALELTLQKKVGMPQKGKDPNAVEKGPSHHDQALYVYVYVFIYIYMYYIFIDMYGHRPPQALHFVGPKGDKHICTYQCNIK